jgi:transcriptional regulator with PAS, ATPase and Fis domain
LEKIIHRSRLMRDVLQDVQRIARTDSTVLITGESGTGKELIAEGIHWFSRRAEGPFVTINMAAVPDSLVESELFGHVRGAFTGAAANRQGRLEAAHMGTLFIDEIGDLKLASQAKLLRVLETRVISAVGDNESRHIDVRVLAATNRNLDRMVEQGTFREDLYYRLNVVRIQLPPLRERAEDIPLLVGHFLDDYCRSYDRPTPSIEPDLMEFLVGHHWRGNIRQLRNCVESMLVLGRTDRLTIHDIPLSIRESERAKAARIRVPDDATLEELEAAAIVQALDRYNGNRTRAANKLGISTRTLQRKLLRNQPHVA